MAVKKFSKKEEKLRHKARRQSIKEGIFAYTRVSLGDHYLSPFAIAINASNSVVALLSSITGFLGPLSQLFGSKLLEKTSRKKIVVRAVFLESLIWLPLIAIAILFYKGILTQILPLALLLFFSIFIILANISHPAWFSWMGDIIDENQRGRWFSKRTLITGFVTVILAISAAFFLDYFKKNNWIMLGFIILFSIAMISRLVCWRIFKKQYEPELKLKKGYYFSFTDFLLNARKTNFGRFAIFRAILSFACSISSPLLAIYLLRFLSFEYSIYMIVILAGTVFSLLILGLWGKFSDKYGNYRVLAITSIITPTIPILWILHPSPIYLIFIPAMVSGISWAGFNLASRNFIYDNVRAQQRGICISYFNMLVGIGTFLGAGTGALLIKFLKVNFVEPIILIFLIGGIVRMTVVFFGIAKVKEIRKTEKFKGPATFKNMIMNETGPTLIEEAHEIISIKDYFHEK